MRRSAAFLATGILAAMSCFQFALALGLPAAQLSWGGKFTGTLPEAYRWASLAAIALLAAAAWVVLSRADIVHPGSGPVAIRISAWIFTAYFGLNTLANIASKSRWERLIMSPAAFLVVVCFAAAAMSRPQHTDSST